MRKPPFGNPRGVPAYASPGQSRGELIADILNHKPHVRRAGPAAPLDAVGEPT